MNTHDPVAFANGLSAKLATRSRHVCAFLGAGASKACGLPDVAALQAKLLNALEEPQKSVFGQQLEGRNLEQALSRLRRISALLADGGGEVDGLSAEDASSLDAKVCRLIIDQLQIDDANLAPVLRLAAWAARADYHQPLELFTVNYDLLVETALERLAVPYFDGFVGALRARFRTDLVEARPEDADAWLPSFLVRLWKLHGSVNWEWEGDAPGEVARLGVPVAAGSPAAIYPSDAKYDESRRVPFVVLQDRFRRALQTPESIVLISGYSWSDDHLNELLFGAARLRPRSEFVSFSYSTLPSALVERAETLPNLQAAGKSEAIIGGIRAPWSAPDVAPPDVWVGGGCALGDFGHLSRFLARSSPRGVELGDRLRQLLAEAGEDG
jgi:hypothetical protein